MGRSLRVVLNKKKKSSSLRTPLAQRAVLYPPCPANNKVLEKYGPNRSVRWTRRSVPQKFGTSEIRSQKISGRNGSVRWTRHSLDTGEGGGVTGLASTEGVRHVRNSGGPDRVRASGDGRIDQFVPPEQSQPPGEREGGGGPFAGIAAQQKEPGRPCPDAGRGGGVNGRAGRIGGGSKRSSPTKRKRSGPRKTAALNGCCRRTTCRWQTGRTPAASSTRRRAVRRVGNRQISVGMGPPSRMADVKGGAEWPTNWDSLTRSAVALMGHGIVTG